MKEGKYYKYAFLDWVSCHTLLVSTIIVFITSIAVCIVSFLDAAKYALLTVCSVIFIGLLIFVTNSFIIDILKSMKRY